MAGTTIGWILVAVGAVLLVLGILAISGGLQWFGRLPGDIRIERESTRVYIPIVSTLLVSVALSLIVRLARRLLP